MVEGARGYKGKEKDIAAGGYGTRPYRAKQIGRHFSASLRDGSKEPAGTKAEEIALLRADMEATLAEIRSAIRIDRVAESVGSRQFAGRGGAKLLLRLQQQQVNK